MAEISGYRAQMWTDTSTNLSTNNPVPLAGEIVNESDTDIIKIGDGVTNYNDLPSYISSQSFPSDSGWTTITTLENGWTGTIYYIKRLGNVTIAIEDLNGSSKTGDVFLTLGSNYIPSNNIRERLFTDDGASEGNLYLNSSTGELSSNGSVASLRGLVTYPVL